MTPQDIERMNAFFDTNHLDTEPDGSADTTDLDHDPEDGEAAGIAYFTDDGRLLLMQRSPDAAEHAGEWAFPAGMLEEGESPEEAALREFQEETGFPLDDTLAGSVSWLDRDTGMRFTAFTAQGPEFEPKLDDEHTNYVWVEPDDLPQPLHPGVVRALKGFPTNKDA